MIDFHMHLLPGIDDGARSCRMSAVMLKECERQEIETLVATPHFYFESKTEKMLALRKKSYNKVINYLKKINQTAPGIILGFEVHLSERIYDEKNLDRLLIGDTNTMLVEMPRVKWDDKVFDRLEYVASKGYNVVLAHPERYISIADEKSYDRLFSYGFAGQINAASLVNPTLREFAYKLIEEGKIQVIGSDAHNVGLRANFINIACDFINQRLGKKYTVMMNENAKGFLGIK